MLHSRLHAPLHVARVHRGSRVSSAQPFCLRSACLSLPQLALGPSPRQQRVACSRLKGGMHAEHRDRTAVTTDAPGNVAEHVAPAADLKPLLYCVGAATLFGVGLGFVKGGDSAAEFFAGYLLEQSLSIDNLFVFVLLFKSFQVPVEHEPKVLEFGIIGAAVLRAIFILLGSAALERFRPILLLFAVILLAGSYKILSAGGEEEEEEHIEDNAIVKFVRSFLPVTSGYRGDAFFVLEDGVRAATPLFLVLVVVELSDLVFAVDSIPAVFGVTNDPFVVYTSNMFAIASLRSLFASVAGSMSEMAYLEKAVALVLGFVGLKMVADITLGLEVPTLLSLAFVATTLAGGVGLSYAFPPADKADE